MKYTIGNYPMQTTAAPAAVATGTSIKTLMQVKSIIPFEITEWGVSYDGSAAATPGTAELIETGTVFATVTAFAEADINKTDAAAILYGNTSTLVFTIGTSASGYTSTGEGSIVAVRNLAGPQLIAPTNQFIQQFPLGERPFCQAGNSIRIRVKFGTTVNALCYMVISTL